MTSQILKFVADSPIGNCNDLRCPPNDLASQATLNKILTAVFLLIGAISVIFIVWGALRFVTASGNPDSTKKARETIIYAIVGLVVAIGGYAIAQFVIDRLK